MMELAVCLAVLAIALGAVLSMFYYGARAGWRSQERREAGRVALAVFDLIDRGFIDQGAVRRGRQADGGFPPGTSTVRSQELMNSRETDGLSGFYAWRPAYVVASPLPLVWECAISDYPSDVGGLHVLEVVVAYNEGDAVPGVPEFGAEDREIERFHAILADGD
jgi:hypothetical protein